MDGLMLLREIKARQPELPVVMVTAYGEGERRRMAEGWAQPSSSPSRSISTC
jgi:CheY-like chemotaxis protein